MSAGSVNFHPRQNSEEVSDHYPSSQHHQEPLQTLNLSILPHHQSHGNMINYNPCLTPSTPIPTHHHLINKPSLPTLPPFILHLQSSYNLLIIIISSFTQWSTSSQSPHTPQTPSHNNPPSVPTCHSSSAKQTSLIGFQTNPHILFSAIRAGKISPNVQSVYPYSVLGNSGPRIWLCI